MKEMEFKGKKIQVLDTIGEVYKAIPHCPRLINKQQVFECYLDKFKIHTDLWGTITDVDYTKDDFNKLGFTPYIGVASGVDINISTAGHIVEFYKAEDLGIDPVNPKKTPKRNWEDFKMGVWIEDTFSGQLYFVLVCR